MLRLVGSLRPLDRFGSIRLAAEQRNQAGHARPVEARRALADHVAAEIAELPILGAFLARLRCVGCGMIVVLYSDLIVSHRALATILYGAFSHSWSLAPI